MDIGGKTALVTGAAMGVGKGIALALARAGARVAVNDIDERGQDTVREIEGEGGEARFFRADVTKEGEIAGLVAAVEKAFGGLDILVNNAGSYYDPPYYPDASPADWQGVLDMFLRTYMVTLQAALPAMQRRGGGIVVNISSAAGVGFGADNNWPDYAAAKAAVMRLTATLAPLHERENVRVNCICPGWVATERVRGYLAEWSEERKRAEDVPDLMLTPLDIGGTVLDLLRDDSLAGRIVLHYEPGKRRIIPTNVDLFELSEEF